MASPLINKNKAFKIITIIDELENTEEIEGFVINLEDDKYSFENLPDDQELVVMKGTYNLVDNKYQFSRVTIKADTIYYSQLIVNQELSLDYLEYQLNKEKKIQHNEPNQQSTIDSNKPSIIEKLINPKEKSIAPIILVAALLSCAGLLIMLVYMGLS